MRWRDEYLVLDEVSLLFRAKQPGESPGEWQIPQDRAVVGLGGDLPVDRHLDQGAFNCLFRAGWNASIS